MKYIKRLKEKKVSVNKTIILRVLECFTEYGILRKIIFEKKVIKYELIHEEKEEHNHIICNKCGKTINIKHDDYIQLIKKTENKTGFKIIDMKDKIFRLCSECKIQH